MRSIILNKLIKGAIVGKYANISFRILAKVSPVQSLILFATTFILGRLNQKPLQLLVGYCPLCAKKSLFLFNPENPRESGNCIKCFANSRYKFMGEIVQKIILLQSCKKDVRFLNIQEELARIPTRLPLKRFLSRLMPPKYTIYEPDSRGALHNLFLSYPRYVFSEYFPNRPPGSLINGILNQDLHHLTFRNNLFDLVITQDVFEHVQHPSIAFYEIFRVLKPGGVHLITVPLHGNQTIKRIDDDGNKLLPEEYHNDHQDKGGALVYTNFGRDIITTLNELGYQAFLISQNNPQKGILGQVDVIVALKR